MGYLSLSIRRGPILLREKNGGLELSDSFIKWPPFHQGSISKMFSWKTFSVHFFKKIAPIWIFSRHKFSPIQKKHLDVIKYQNYSTYTYNIYMYVIIYVKDKKKVNFRAHKKTFLWEVGVWRSTSELRFLASDSEERSNMARVPVSTSAWLFFLVLWMRSKNGCITYYMLFEWKGL